MFGKINKIALIVGVVLLGVAVAALYFAVSFVDSERQRALQEWQIRLGIVADSRAAAVNQWIDGNFATLRELSENASLQIYMDELAMSSGDKSAVTDEPAQAGYLRNLLVATAERAGFKPPETVGQVNANIERAGVAGLGLVDAAGAAIVSTPGMPPMNSKIRKAVATALDGQPALIDAYMGAGNHLTIGFALPVYGIQSDEGAEGIGVVIGIRTLGKNLYANLAQPGEQADTAETYLVRKSDAVVQYLSPLKDGTSPLVRSFALDTPDLAAAYALESPGGFALKKDYVGTDVLVTSRSLSNTQWILVRKIDSAEALSETETRLSTILIVFVLIIVGMAVTIIAVWRHGSSIRAAKEAEKSRVAAERFANMSKFMNLITNSLSADIIAVTNEGKYTFVNAPAAQSVAEFAGGELRGKHLTQILGPTKGGFYRNINDEILTSFALSDDTNKERRTLIQTFGEGDDIEIIKSDHIPLRGDRDYPPGMLMVMENITEQSMERVRNEAMTRQLIGALVNVVEQRDPHSSQQSARISLVASTIAREMEMTDDQVRTIDIAGSLVNLGRVFIPNRVMAKTEPLSSEEAALFENSDKDSIALLKDVDFRGSVKETISQAQEHWDGSGPLALNGEDILQTARILAVARAFVGLVSPRKTEPHLSFNDAAAELVRENGQRFDRRPVSALIHYMDNKGGAAKWAYFLTP